MPPSFASSRLVTSHFNLNLLSADMSGEDFDTLFGELFGDTLDDTKNHNSSVAANANEKLDDTTDGAEQDDHLSTLTNEFTVPHVPPQDWLFSVATPRENGIDQTLSLPISGWPDTFSFRHAAVPNEPPGLPDDAQVVSSQETATTECVSTTNTSKASAAAGKQKNKHRRDDGVANAQADISRQAATTEGASTTNTSKATAPAGKRKNKRRRDDEIEDASSDQPSTSVAQPAKKVVRRRGRPRKNQDTDPQPSTTAIVATPSSSMENASVNQATPGGGDLLPSTGRPTSSARLPQHNAHPTTSASSFQPPLSGTGFLTTTRPMASSSYPSRGAMNGGFSHPVNGTGMLHATPPPPPSTGMPPDRPMLYKRLAKCIPGFNPVIFEQNLALFGENAIAVIRARPFLLIRPALPSATQLLAYDKGLAPAGSQPPARVHTLNNAPPAVLPRPAISRPVGGFRTQPRSYVPSPLGRVTPTCATPPSYVAYPALSAQWQDRAGVGVSDQHNIRAQGNLLTPIQPPIPQAGSSYTSDHLYLYQPIAGPSRPTFTRPSQENFQLALTSPSLNVPSVIGLPFGSQTTATNMAAILPASPHAPPTALDWQNRPYSFPVEFASVHTLETRPN
ncbi:hypothetical protein ONZ45_g16309 [Pleurotus djamor]|nr:hypothetical protein ONZ45_g16309 [Pleurotus djamor]